MSPIRDSQLNNFEWFLVVNIHLLNTYCAPFIAGDFSKWLVILEYFNEKTKDDYLTRTGKELPEYIYKELEEYIGAKKR